jgi:drug/metabolite transporter (DMT)-like permease
MKWWQVALLGATALTLLLAGLALWMLRRDSSVWARRLRQQAVGMVLMVGVIPTWLLLEDRLGVGPYALLLVFLVTSGGTLFIRGGGWGRSPQA